VTPAMAHLALEGKAAELKRELPGVTFGYIGNCGVDRSGPFDDRSWYIFLPHPGRVGDYSDRVGGYRTRDLARMLEGWDRLADAARREMGTR
jgi:hypothetical protein